MDSSSAFLGAFGAGIAGRLLRMGLSAFARFMLEFGADVLASTAVDVLFRRAQLGEAFQRNLIASLFGSLVGELIGAGFSAIWRGGQAIWRGARAAWNAFEEGGWRGVGGLAWDAFGRGARQSLNDLWAGVRSRFDAFRQNVYGFVNRNALLHASLVMGGIPSNFGGAAERLIGRPWQYTTSAPTRLPSWFNFYRKGIPWINNRRPRNYRYRGRNYEFSPGSDLANNYPLGVDFDNDGFPIFDRYVIRDPMGNPYTVQLDNLRGTMPTDSDLAEGVLNPNFVKTDAATHLDQQLGGIWHHLQDGRTMMLIPQTLHETVRHTGGEAVIEHFQEIYLPSLRRGR